MHCKDLLSESRTNRHVATLYHCATLIVLHHYNQPTNTVTELTEYIPLQLSSQSD